MRERENTKRARRRIDLSSRSPIYRWKKKNEEVFSSPPAWRESAREISPIVFRTSSRPRGATSSHCDRSIFSTLVSSSALAIENALPESATIRAIFRDERGSIETSGQRRSAKRPSSYVDRSREERSHEKEGRDDGYYVAVTGVLYSSPAVRSPIRELGSAHARARARQSARASPSTVFRG